MDKHQVKFRGSVYEKILSLLLEGVGNDLAILRQQSSAVDFVEVEDTGVGFFIDFPDLEGIQKVSKDFPRVYGEVNGYDCKTDNIIIGSALFIENGTLNMLEIYSFEGDLKTPLEELEFRQA